MTKLKICFISTNPSFLGGTAMFLYNLLEYLKKTKNNLDEFTWIYKGKENKKYKKKGINFVEIKGTEFYPLGNFLFNFKILKFLKKNYYDIINSHIVELWINFYKKRDNQKIICTYHGTDYYFFKNHFKRFNLIKKIFFSPLLFISWLQERPPIKKVDKFICVSQKAKRQVEKLYGKKENSFVIRTGVDLKNFKPRNKNKIKEKLNFDKKKIYGLYVGRGGYWTKGLDRVIKISERIYNLNKNYRLIVIGSNLKKVGPLLNKKFIIYIEQGKREMMPYYYNSANIFFCMSRYEGGAPTLVVSEAMASGCLVVCSKDSEQEIIEEGKNGLIIESFGKESAEKVLKILEDKKKKEKIIRNSMETIKEISLEKWGKKYSDVLFG